MKRASPTRSARRGARPAICSIRTRPSASAAARSLLAERSETPVVALATAHPAKFPEAVERATGVRPALPPHLADLMDRRERFTVLPNDQAAVERFIRDRARAVRGAAA